MSWLSVRPRNSSEKLQKKTTSNCKEIEVVHFVSQIAQLISILSCIRCLVWADIAKISHDNAVWDVARSSARFCLQYDDGRWEEAASVVPAVEPHRLASALGSHSKSSLKVSARSAISVAPTLPIPSPIMSRSLPSVDHGRTLQVKESHLKTVATGRSKADLMARQLLRRLVEAHFIYAEVANNSL